MSTSSELETKILEDFLHLYFDERDNRPAELQHLRPNGFTEEKVISDFPARNRKLVQHIRQRRWLDEDGKSVILNVYELATNGTKFSDEFAEFRPPILSNGDTLVELLTRSKHALTQTHDKLSRTAPSEKSNRQGMPSSPGKRTC